MYLSRLKLDPYDRKTRQLRLRPYSLHQAVYSAFPDRSDGGPGRVLYRLDTARNGEVALLVQSDKPPDWLKAAALLDCLASPLEPVKAFEPAFKPGQRLYFRLRANPVAKRRTPDRMDTTRRLGLVREEEQLRWLERKGTGGGFRVLSCTITPEGKITDRSGAGKPGVTHHAVRFEGVLVVVDPDLFVQTLRNGIGPAKGFGFGLLSLAPA